MGEPCKEIAKHFGRVSALLLASWTLRKIICRTKAREDDMPKGDSKLIRTQSHRLIPHPECQFEVATPDWIPQYIHASDRDIPQPEHLIQAVEDIRGRPEDFELGKPALLEQLFLLRRDVAQHYLNAGSYGGVYRLAADAQTWYQALLEEEPCYFNTEIAPRALQVAKQRLADFIGAPAADIIHLTNATAAVNTVLHSTVLHRGDLLLITSITYAAVRNAASRFAARAGAGIVEVLLDLDTLLQGSQAIAARFESTLKRYGSRIKLVILDHITSNPTVHIPIQRIASACRKIGVKGSCFKDDGEKWPYGCKLSASLATIQNPVVLVDGAHAVGATPLDVSSLGVDYYTSNLHKWGCCPKSAAFLWVHPESQNDMVPLITSHGYRTGFQGEFAWQGTSDISAWLAVPVALQLKEALGVQRLRKHNHDKLVEAVTMLRAAWGKQLIVLGSDAPSSHMATVELPELVEFPPCAKSPSRLHSYLLHQKKIEVPITFWESRLWVRISAQIYNTMLDYISLKAAILELID